MKFKLLLVFVFAVSAVILVGYVSHLGLTRLMRTLQQTVQPDSREQDIESLLYHVSESENNVRLFTILRDFRYLKSYRASLENSKTVLAELIQKSAGDSLCLDQLDSVDLLLRQKINTQQRLINLSRERQKINIYEEALPKIKSLAERDEIVDSLREVFLRAELILEKEIAAKEALLSSERNALDDEDKIGLFKNLFGESKKKKEEKEEQNQIIEQYTGELDNLLASKDTLVHIADTLRENDITEEIQAALLEIKEREQNIISELAEIEVGLTRKDHEIGLEIQKHMQQLQLFFEQTDISRAEQAGSFFNQISNRITIVGSVFSMLFIIMLFVVLNDFQVRERNRKVLESAKEKAEKLGLAKDEFLSSVSHEIRTPLNAILGFTEQLEDSELSNDQLKYVDIIKNASNHLLAIINDILDFAKIEAGKIRLESIPFSIEEHANFVYNTLQKKADDKKIKLSIRYGTGVENLTVIGDPVRFRQIIFNLLDNAIKFTENGTVRLLLDYGNFHIQIKVIDSGIGIPEKDLNSIFNKFDQATEGSKSKYGGTGLGLSIVKSLVDLQNGTIAIKSVEKKGSEFIVKLPCTIAKAEDMKAVKQTVSAGHDIAKEVSILIVDDEEYNRLLIEAILNKHKIKNKSVPSGQEAVDLYRAEQFDAVLLDLQMEGLNGFETAKVLQKEAKSTLKIIAVTASAGNNIRTDCLEAGFVDVLVKPVSEKDLLNCLQKYLGKKTDKRLNVSDNVSSQPSKLRALKELFDKDELISEKMTAIYLNNLKQAVEIFAGGMDNRELDAVRKTAHKIIPSSRHMGFEQFADQLKELENGIESGSKNQVIKVLLPAVVTACKGVTKSIEDFMLSEKEKNQHT